MINKHWEATHIAGPGRSAWPFGGCREPAGTVPGKKSNGDGTLVSQTTGGVTTRYTNA